MELPILIIAAAVLLGFYGSFMGGANDFANAFATSVSSRAITMRTAILIAVLANFFGAVLVGSHVTDTIRKGIVEPTAFAGDPLALVYGMLAAMIAAGVFLHIATAMGWPVSTTHSIVGAVVGFGVIAAGVSSISWGKLAVVATSWVLSPVVGGLLAYVIFRAISRLILTARRPPRAARRYLPYVIGIVIATILLSLGERGLRNLRLGFMVPYALLAVIAVGIVTTLIALYVLGRPRPAHLSNGLDFVERQFRYLQVVTASYVAFAHGSNDVANGVGPLAAIIAVWNTGEVAMKVEVPLWVLALGGLGICAGTAAFGRAVMTTVGTRITEITPSRGFTAEFAAASTVLLCSRLGLPVSTTQTLVGAVIGVGFARGMGAIDLRVVRNIVGSWVITVPATIVLAIITYKLVIAFVP